MIFCIFLASNTNDHIKDIINIIIGPRYGNDMALHIYTPFDNCSLSKNWSSDTRLSSQDRFQVSDSTGKKIGKKKKVLPPGKIVISVSNDDDDRQAQHSLWRWDNIRDPNRLSLDQQYPDYHHSSQKQQTPSPNNSENSFSFGHHYSQPACSTEGMCSLCLSL